MVSNGERRREGHHLKLCVCTRRYTPNAKLSQLLVQRRVVGAIKHISEKTATVYKTYMCCCLLLPFIRKLPCFSSKCEFGGENLPGLLALQYKPPPPLQLSHRERVSQGKVSSCCLYVYMLLSVFLYAWVCYCLCFVCLGGGGFSFPLF